MKETMQKVLNKIKEYDTILIFRHFRPDGDAVGSTRGLAEILRLTYPEKKIYLQNEDFCDYMSFYGDEDPILPDETYASALGICMDTATGKRLSSQRYTMCKEVIKFDHHIPVENYGDICWVEEHRSSCCEMVAAFYDEFKDELKMNKQAATYIYTGMVTDSGRFRFREVSGETMRLAGMILDQGVDTETLYAHLYLREVESFRFESYVHENMNISPAGVASIYVSQELQTKFGLTGEEASSSVSYMDSIKGSLIWLAFIENTDGTIRVRLRSRFVTVSELAERYSGGGHACAAGATVYSVEEMEKLLAEADELLKNYKENNEGWL
jgi:phosphoesterase RecJ-like protein